MGLTSSTSKHAPLSAPASAAPPAPRRIVTSIDSKGAGSVLYDGPVRLTNAPGPLMPSARFGVPWQTASAPADSQAGGDGAELPSGELVNTGGSCCRYVDYPPVHSSPMHRTDSLDYGFVVFGEMELELDDGSVTVVKPGDCVVMRSTIHAWHNRSNQWARMVYILLPAKEIIVDGKVLAPISIH